jgi:hypothetical protein
MRRLIGGTIVAIALAMVGVGASGLAQQDLNGPNPAPGDVSVAAASALGGPKLSAWAVINGTNGAAVRGEKILSSQRLGVGAYEVRIAKLDPPVPANVTKCAFVANVGSIALSGTEPTGQITTVGRAGDSAGVFIATSDSNGVSADRSFHLLVVC